MAVSVSPPNPGFFGMDPQIADLLCAPETRAPLEFTTGRLRDMKSGQYYPIRAGIPVFLHDVSGLNRKFQTMYDRLAPGYDLAEKIYRWVTRKPDFRTDYLRELQIPAGGRVLEVSVGTGLNLPYLPQDSELFGLDLSWGMLRRCGRNLQRWRRKGHLFQGEAEQLPFRDAVFDCVFHVGGINFFNDKARALAEMVRVAKPGTKLLVVDENERVVREHYQRNPLTRKYFEGERRAASCPIDLLPDSVQQVQARDVAEGRLYRLTFRKPATSYCG
jgi:ubiquinone/menaquinone biosynthesis C-methylase UbiE/uncharacterized protein YbaR (Trm112 family)